MSNDPIQVLNQFCTEITARSMEQLEAFKIEESVRKQIKRGIYALRDSFVLKLKTGEAGYDYSNKR